MVTVLQVSATWQAFMFITGGGDSAYFRHNSIYVGGGYQNTTYGKGLALQIDQNQTGNYNNVTILNNIFYNDRFGNSNNALVKIPQGGSVFTLFKCNYNQYYADTFNYFMYNNLSFSGWKQASGFDLNSFLKPPLYVNPLGNNQNINLHLQPFNYSESSGITTTVSVDFDNDNRAAFTPVDIGADAGNFTLLVKPNLGPNITMCSNDSVILNAGTYNSYLWSNGATTPTISVTSPGQYIVHVINQANLPDADTIIISTIPSPTIAFTTSSNTVCAGSPISFTLSGASTYSINSTSAAANFSLNPGSTGVYTLQGTAANGCVNSQTLFITVNSLPPVTLSPSNSVACSGDTVSLTPGGALNYTYNSATAVVNGTTIVTYTVTGSDAQNCTNNAVCSVTFNPLPIISVSSSNSLICVSQSASITATGASSYTWNSGQTGAAIVVSPTITTTYSVTGSDNNGCISSASITQSVSTCTGFNDELIRDNEIDIYPNPAQHSFSVSIKNIDAETLLTVYSITGQTLLSKRITKNVTEMNISQLANGVYYLRVSQREGQRVYKLIKQ